MLCLAPYLPLLNQLDPSLNQSKLEVALLLGVRTTAEFIYGDSLIEYESNHAGFSLTVCYSRESPVTPQKFDYAD